MDITNRSDAVIVNGIACIRSSPTWRFFVPRSDVEMKFPRRKDQANT
ncbi:hypothetical protein SynBMKMC1_01005 [Synechococcus sp. BMK-MC-1]|nr:hypothetical protein SynBMKMC1_01005 [Synechococcus sp. BMK-MC-1]